MKTLLRIFTLLVILGSLYCMLPAFFAFKSITDDPEGWMGGVNPEATMVWFALIFLGFGYLAFATFLAMLGWLFGQSKRKAAFWLLKLPGILGMVLCVFLLFIFYQWDIDWAKHSFVFAFLIIPFGVYALYGHHIRKLHPKKVSK